MSKQYQYQCTKCHFLFPGNEDTKACIDCGHDELTKITFGELIKDLTGESMNKDKKVDNV